MLTPNGRMLALRGEGSLADGALVVSDGVELVPRATSAEARPLDG